MRSVANEGGADPGASLGDAPRACRDRRGSTVAVGAVARGGIERDDQTMSDAYLAYGLPGKRDRQSIETEGYGPLTPTGGI
jgi:hypothetical protein